MFMSRLAGGEKAHPSGSNGEDSGGPDSPAIEVFFSAAYKIVLSGVRNTFALFRTPLRRSRLVSLLRGLAPRGVAALARRDLPEFGAFVGLPVAWVDDLVDALVEEGYIELGDSPGAGVRASLRTPPLRLSRAGLRVLQDQESLPTRLSCGRYRRSRPTGREAVMQELESKLFALRRELAADEGRPVYGIFPNSLLGEIVLRRPRNIGELAELPGMGPQRLQKYAQPILSVIKEVLSEEEEGMTNDD